MEKMRKTQKIFIHQKAAAKRLGAINSFCATGLFPCPVETNVLLMFTGGNERDQLDLKMDQFEKIKHIFLFSEGSELDVNYMRKKR